MRIAILGASGLIGEAVAADLQRNGIPVIAIARKFTDAQRVRFGRGACQTEIVELDDKALLKLFTRPRVNIIVNCIGVLQDGRRGKTSDVNFYFAKRLMAVLEESPKSFLLIHVSVPGVAAEDPTDFSRTKHQADQRIAESTVPHVILRPGFVVAPAAYGGSALIRALAASSFDLPRKEQEKVFMTTSIDDVTATVRTIAERWSRGERDWAANWDIMHPNPIKLGTVISSFRERFGRLYTDRKIPRWLLELGAKAGDLSARLGWSPPIRTNALRELQRGVVGDPGPWMAATGIKPATLKDTLDALSVGVQDVWFTRLYVLKPLIIVVLVLFWLGSGLTSLTGSVRMASVWGGLAEIAIGALIAFRRTCRIGLYAGIGLSLFYMAGALMTDPDLWLQTLGALVKTGPAIVLMLVTLAILPDR